MPGAVTAYGINGSPADAAMLALASPLFAADLGSNKFDLLVSGINRGDNAGMHVVYSGTVGAAREAAMHGILCLALSLDNYLDPAQNFVPAATMVVPLVKAFLGLGSVVVDREALKGTVTTVNLPNRPVADVRGYFHTFQGLSTLSLHWAEVDKSQANDGPPPSIEEEVALYQGGGGATTSPRGTNAAASPAGPPADAAAPRVFKKEYGHLLFDETPGSDAWAMHHGWVSVTLLALQQDMVGPDVGTYASCTAGSTGEGQKYLGPPTDERDLRLPYPFMDQPAVMAAARFGGERLDRLRQLVELAATEMGKEQRSWLAFGKDDVAACV